MKVKGKIKQASKKKWWWNHTAKNYFLKTEYFGCTSLMGYKGPGTKITARKGKNYTKDLPCVMTV